MSAVGSRSGRLVALFAVGMLVFFLGGYWAGIPMAARTYGGS
jgi:hypothetical protein